MDLSFGKRFPEAMRRIKRCNILVIGNTGAGKSTLISSLFQVSISNSVTQKISTNPYTKLGLSIAAYDTPGLENENKQRNKVKEDIAKFIKQQNQKEPEEQIHAVWYCVNSQVNRKSQIDQQWIESLSKELPVIAVITRATGVEKKELQPYLEEISSIRRVVPIIAKKEELHHSNIDSYGLDSLLHTTENLLNEIAQKAILNAVNSKVDQAFGWCRDGCAKVLAAELIPFAPLKTFARGSLQVWMLADISKTFGYQFDQTILSELCALGTGAVGFDGWIESALKNLPGLDYNNIQTVKDVLSHLTTMLEHTAGILPYKEQLVEMLTDVSNSALVSGLPILNCISAIATTLSTGFLAVAYIETMKTYKKAEYEGQLKREIKQILNEQMQQLMEIIRQLFGGELSFGFGG